MTDPRAVPAPGLCAISAWDPARVVRASRTACHVRVPRPRRPLTHTPAWCVTAAWDPARVVRASRTRAMLVCRVLVAPPTPPTHPHTPSTPVHTPSYRALPYGSAGPAVSLRVPDVGQALGVVPGYGFTRAAPPVALNTCSTHALRTRTCIRVYLVQLSCTQARTSPGMEMHTMCGVGVETVPLAFLRGTDLWALGDKLYEQRQEYKPSPKTSERASQAKLQHHPQDQEPLPPCRRRSTRSRASDPAAHPQDQEHRTLQSTIHTRVARMFIASQRNSHRGIQSLGEGGTKTAAHRARCTICTCTTCDRARRRHTRDNAHKAKHRGEHAGVPWVHRIAHTEYTVCRPQLARVSLSYRLHLNGTFHYAHSGALQSSVRRVHESDRSSATSVIKALLRRLRRIGGIIERIVEAALEAAVDSGVGVALVDTVALRSTRNQTAHISVHWRPGG
eukprot:4444612-Prymnesium_polylepis.1